MKTAKEYREEAAGLVKKQQEIVDAATKEKRNLNTDEQKSWDEMDKDYEGKISSAKILEKQEARKAEMAASEGRTVGDEDEDNADADAELTEEQTRKMSRKEKEAFRTLLTSGWGAMTPEQRGIFKMIAEKRTQSTTAAAGGYTIPQGFGGKVIEYMKAFGGVRSVAFVFPTESGNLLPFPTNDDTSNTGALLAEAADSSASVTDLTFGQTSLGAFTYTSKLIKISKQLIQDSHFDITAYVQKKLAERLGRIQNLHFTTGDGSSKPEGIVIGATAGVTAASATAITADEVLDLQFAVDPAYRSNPGAGYMFNDATLKAIKKLKDSQGRYLWSMGDISKGEPSTIWNKPYTVNQDMATIATGAKTLIFGDLKEYYIRDVMDMSFSVLNERYAEFFLVAVVGFMRSDGKLMNTASVKYLVQA